MAFSADEFLATYRGRVFPNQKLDPDKVIALGFLLGDKTAGPRKLEIEWIKVRNGFAINAAMLFQRDRLRH